MNSSASANSSRARSSSICRESRAVLIAPLASPTRLPTSALAAGGSAPISRLAKANGERSPACAKRTSLRAARSPEAETAARASATIVAMASAPSTATCLGSNEVFGPDIRSEVSHSPRIALANCSTVASRSPVPCKIRSGCSGTSYT